MTCRSLVTLVALLVAAAAASSCPGDAGVRAPGTLLSLDGAAAGPRAYDAAALSKLPPATLTQRQSVTSSDGARAERTVAWGGVRLRDVLLDAGFGGPDDRAARTVVVEARASDGYRAVFSWGELFNADAGAQVLVVSRVDGQPLDTRAGPLALRSLADQRPGPRHVRNLCGLTIRR